MYSLEHTTTHIIKSKIYSKYTYILQCMWYTHSMIKKEVLEALYLKKNLSMKEISTKLGFSVNKVSYWMKFHGIKRRSISEGVYIKNNPKGDPFLFNKPKVESQSFLLGLGMGLYWGEGTKANKHSVRLGNTDPKLILWFIKFLKEFFSVDKKNLRFGLQVFSNMPEDKVLDFWVKELRVSRKQFMKVVVTNKRGLGTYTRKIEHGVLTVYFHNIKMRNILVGEIEKLKEIR